MVIVLTDPEKNDFKLRQTDVRETANIEQQLQSDVDGNNHTMHDITLTNVTLTAPTIADFSNADHDHTTTSGGNIPASSIGGTTAFKSLNTYRFPSGVRIGADSTDNLIDDGSNGASTTAIYIGNDEIVKKAATQTLTNKTLTSPVLTTPTIASFTNATHDHSAASAGGNIPAASITAGAYSSSNSHRFPSGLRIGADSTNNVIDDAATGASTTALYIGNDEIVKLAASQTLTNKTLTTPTISSTGFTNATHAHAAANSGGQLNFTSCFDTTTKTRYYSISPTAFTGSNPDVDNITINYINVVNDSGGSLTFYAPVNLPNGAVITGAILYGDSELAWSLVRQGFSGGAVGDIAGSTPGNEDTTITNGTVDNTTYSYAFIHTMENTKKIYGARVTYTITADNQG